MKSLYLLIDLFTVSIPFLFSFHSKLKFYKYFKPFFISNFLVAAIFILWDIAFTSRGIWGFNPDYILGIYVFNLPIEEILFFICIPFACVFTYHCINLFFKLSWEPETETIVVVVVCIGLLITGLYFRHKSYTALTFISLSIILFAFKFLIGIDWLPKLVRMYPLLLVPFFIVNGILTGTGISTPIVWYNDSENMVIRLLTIPLEDVFYGFELILLNVFFYEYFKGENKNMG